MSTRPNHRDHSLGGFSLPASCWHSSLDNSIFQFTRPACARTSRNDFPTKKLNARSALITLPSPRTTAPPKKSDPTIRMITSLLACYISIPASRAANDIGLGVLCRAAYDPVAELDVGELARHRLEERRQRRGIGIDDLELRVREPKNHVFTFSTLSSSSRCANAGPVERVERVEGISVKPDVQPEPMLSDHPSRDRGTVRAQR